MRNKPKKDILYKVEWWDINHFSEWVDKKELNDKIQEYLTDPETNYWIFVKEAKGLYLFTSGYDKKQFFDIIVVPKGIVKKLTPIKKVC